MVECLSQKYRELHTELESQKGFEITSHFNGALEWADLQDSACEAKCSILEVHLHRASPSQSKILEGSRD
jgi:hypothetical protein